MRPGMDALIELLRGQDLHTSDPEIVLALAAEQHLLPIISRRLLDGPPLSEPMQAQLRANQRDATIAAFFWSSELRSLLRAFANAELDVLALKGPSLAERLYGSTSLRTSHDLDLLVRQADYAAAESLLTSLGFIPAGRTDDYHRQWRRASSTVELHFNVEHPLAIDFAIAGAWRNAIPATFAEQPCRLFAPADELLFLCIHGVRHRFERLSLVLDIALALERYSVEPLQLRPEVAHLERLLLLGTAMARHLRPDVPQPRPSSLGPVEQARIQVLADQLWRELTNETPKELDWSAQHDFFLQIEPTSWRRLTRRAAHLRIAATRLIEPDFAFAQRFGLTRPWQAWMLRPVRLLLSRWPLH